MCINRTFLTAGQAVFTLEIPAEFSRKNDTASHYTFRIEHQEASARWPEAYFVGLLTGTDNTRDYSYLGMLGQYDGGLRLTGKSCAGEDAWSVRLLRRVLSRLWAGQDDEISKAGFTLHHEGHCGRCGKELTHPISIRTGIGPECRKLMGIEG